jgi:hypothetical protein
MTVATKTKSAGIKVTTKTKVKVAKPKTFTVAQLKAERKREQDRRNKEKIEILERHSTSEDLFDALIQEIRTLSDDESSNDFSVGNDYNYGVDYEVDMLLELIRDLREFTQYNREDDDESITDSNLDYLRPYF